MKKKVWDKPNPKKKSTPLTPAQKASAKRSAKAAGRPYPNLVDNMKASQLKRTSGPKKAPIVSRPAADTRAK